MRLHLNWYKNSLYPSLYKSNNNEMLIIVAKKVRKWKWDI